MKSGEEAYLLERAREGNEQSFELIVQHNSEKLIQLAWRMLHNRADAEEIVQEAFLRLYRSLGTFRGDSRLSTWLYRTVTRLCIDTIRREKIKRKLFFFGKVEDEYDPLDHIPANTSNPDELAIAREEVGRVMQAMCKLSGRQRAVLTLRHQEQLPLADIADILGLTVGSVKVHLHRAVKALHAALDEEETTHGK